MNKATLSFGRTPAGIVLRLFGGCVIQSAQFICVYSPNDLWAPDDWVTFLVLLLPGEVKVYINFGENRGTEVKIMFVLFFPWRKKKISLRVSAPHL